MFSDQVFFMLIGQSRTSSASPAHSKFGSSQLKCQELESRRTKSVKPPYGKSSPPQLGQDTFLDLTKIRNFFKERHVKYYIMETVTLPRVEFEQMQEELKILRDSKLYQRLLDFEKNITTGKRYTRKDLGF